MKRFHLAILILIAACSAKNKDIHNQTQKGHEELYASPDAPAKVKNKLKRIVIAATNDIHGQYAPSLIEFEDKDNKGKQAIQVGGVQFISSYFKILKETYDHVLLVDSGDIFPQNSKDLDYARKFYQEMGYDAISIGLSDFNLQLPKGTSSTVEMIKDFAKGSKVPLLLSNLYDLKTARAVEWKGTKSYEIKEIGGIKVGILGIIPNDITSLTPIDNRVGLYVENMLQNTLRYARLVRSLGAQMVVVLTHQSVECGRKIAKAQNLPLSKVNFEPEKADACEMNGIMGEYLTRLPPHLVDVVVGGRNHQKMANFFNGTLLLSGFPEGRSFSYAEFYFDSQSGKIQKDKTVVKQPVMFCHEFFKETSDCYTEDPSVDHKPKIPAEFLGKEIKPDESIKQKFQKFFAPASAQVFQPVIENLLNRFEAQLAFMPRGHGTSQLVTISLTGHQLKKILDERYNQGKSAEWLPQVFETQGKSLHIKINDEMIQPEKTYRVLADLESLQQDRLLKKFITAELTKSLVEHSWNSIAMEDADAISHQLSAPQRQ